METKFFELKSDPRYECIADLVILSRENYHEHKIYHMHLNDIQKYDLENIFLNKKDMFEILRSDHYDTLRQTGGCLIYVDEDLIDEVGEEICNLELNELL